MSTIPNLTREDRIVGCLLGGALGDAIGAYFEGQPSPSGFAIPQALSVTDDTQLTIATCEAIIESGTVHPEHIATHFVRWFRERRITRMGSSTLKALRELEVGGHWAMVGATGEYSAGNGAAMRIAPLAVVLDPGSESARQTIRDVCRITHRNDEAYIGALAVCWSIRQAIDGNELDISNLIGAIPDSRVRDRMIEVRDASLTIREYGSRYAASGYVVDSVPLAILAASQTSDVLAGIRQIVDCGGDTDTIASIYGQIVGTAIGAEALPWEMVKRIDTISLVRTTANRLASSARVIERDWK